MCLTICYQMVLFICFTSWTYKGQGSVVLAVTSVPVEILIFAKCCAVMWTDTMWCGANRQLIQELLLPSVYQRHVPVIVRGIATAQQAALVHCRRPLEAASSRGTVLIQRIHVPGSQKLLPGHNGSHCMMTTCSPSVRAHRRPNMPLFMPLLLSVSVLHLTVCHHYFWSAPFDK